MPYKNTAVHKQIYAWDAVNGVPKTGDAANITVRGVGDGVEYTPSAPNITEVDSTNLPGVYDVALTAGENNYSNNMIGGKSSTSGVAIQPVQWSNEISVTSSAVASVTGAVGSVTGAVGSVTGNVGGNVVGSVGSVTGAVGSVTGNVGGNVVGSVASVTGNVGGNVVGSVASVTGAVGSVTGNVGGNVVGNVNGTVASVVGNVGGNVVGSVGSVVGAVGSVTAPVTIAAGQLFIKKNAALNNFMFVMLGNNGKPKTGLTVTAQRDIDGAGFGACANAVSEIGSGWYSINLAATDLNGTVIAFKFTATSALDRDFTVVTQL